MIVAGALEENRSEPTLFMPDSKIQGTPTAESTRIPLMTSTEKKGSKGAERTFGPRPTLKDGTNHYI